MSNKIYDRLDYVGNAKYIVLNIYPSKKEVKLSSNNPYYFTDNDILNKDSIKYYESFYSNGIRLHKIDDKENVINENSEELPKIKDVVNEEKIESEEIKIDTPEEDIPEESIENEVVDETPSENLEATRDEMIEFLDLTYDESTIKSVARESGINRIRNDWDKSTIISKIIDNNSQFVINLMKH